MGLNEKYTELKPEKAEDFLAFSSVWNPLFLIQTQGLQSFIQTKSLMRFSTR